MGLPFDKPIFMNIKPTYTLQYLNKRINTIGKKCA